MDAARRMGNMGMHNENKDKKCEHQCNLCCKFQIDGWTIENEKDEETPACFPKEYQELVVVESSLSNGHGKEILQCPKCGLMYEYTISYPGGSYDAIITIILESIMPIFKNRKHLRKNVPTRQNIKEDKIKEYECPNCKSDEIDVVAAGIIGGETFISLKCNHCGNEDTLDEYQIIIWKKSQKE